MSQVNHVRNDCKLYVDYQAGEYVVETSTEVKRSFSLVSNPGQTSYVRFKVRVGFFEVMQPTVTNFTGRNVPNVMVMMRQQSSLTTASKRWVCMHATTAMLSP